MVTQTPKRAIEGMIFLRPVPVILVAAAPIEKIAGREGRFTLGQGPVNSTLSGNGP
jgi:hypothetical protein